MFKHWIVIVLSIIDICAILLFVCGLRTYYSPLRVDNDLSALVVIGFFILFITGVLYGLFRSH